MQMVELFYCVCWTTAVSVLWFLTDTWFYYAQLLNVADKIRNEFVAYFKANPEKYFPDFLYKKSLTEKDPGKKFLLKLVSCPFCLTFWLSIATTLYTKEAILIGPVYVLSLITFLQIKRMF